MIVNPTAAADFHLAARDAPGWGVTLEVKASPLGGHDIADPRTGVGDQPVCQSHAGSDSGNFCTAKNLAQLWKREQRGMMNDVRRLLEYFDHRFSGIVRPQAPPASE